MATVAREILLFVPLAVAAASIHAQSGVDHTAYKSADGVLIVSERPNQYFSIGIPGDGIHLVGPNEIYVLGDPEAGAHHPFIMAGDRCLQIMPVPIAEFKGNPQLEDDLILRQQAKYELDAQHTITSKMKRIVLPNGREALFYSCRVREAGPGSETQVFVALRQNSYVLVLTSNVPRGDTEERVKSFLGRVVSSFYASKTPIRPKAQPYTG
jgi:hypothetical protein